MYQFNIFLYFAILGTAIWMRNITAVIAVVVVGLVILCSIPAIRQFKRQLIKKSIKEFPNVACLNINRATWYEIEELPDVSRVEAKRAVYLRRKEGLYASKDDFFKRTNIKDTEELRTLIEL